MKKSLSNLRFYLEISASRPCHASLRARRVGEVTFEVAHLGESLSRRHKDTEKSSCSERRRPRRHHRLVFRFASFLRLPTHGYAVDSFAPAQLIRRISRPAPPSELPCGSLSRPFPKVSILPSGQPSVSLSRACPGARLSFPLGYALSRGCSLPAHLALRAACGRLPSQRPLACVRARSSRPSGCLR